MTAATTRGPAAVGVGSRLAALPRWVVVGLLRLYQRVVSPLYAPTCRFHPSCSQYALVAVERHGVVRGAGLAAWRLLRCNPWNPGGVDDVPPVRGQDEPGPSHDDHGAVRSASAPDPPSSPDRVDQQHRSPAPRGHHDF